MEFPPDRPSPPPITRRSRVLAVVTHYRCEPWLAQCLESLVRQTRPPEAIVVLDDASPDPPTEIVRAFPQVTLLTSPANVGPFRLQQSLFDRADYDAFLMQDADDWSAPDRLELLLAAAEASGAEMVGCQVENHLEGVTIPAQATYPADVRGALHANPVGSHLCMGTSILSRDLVQRLGGMASGMRFGGDSEFMRRAILVAHTTNIPDVAYHRRRHPNSLTMSATTGFQSPARKAVQSLLQDRVRQNIWTVLQGRLPDLAPLAVAPSLDWRHLVGPRLREQHRPARLNVPSRKTPILITGMPRSGTAQVATLLQRCGLSLPPGHPTRGSGPETAPIRPDESPLVRLNTQGLDKLGGAWDEPPEKQGGGPLPQVAALLETHARSTPWGWDDPQMTLLLASWQQVEPWARVVHCVRHPLEVAHSLQQRCGMSLRRALGLWQRYNECFLATAPAGRRRVVHFDQLTHDTLPTLQRLAAFCELPEPPDGWTKALDAIDPTRRNHRFTAAELVEARVSPEILRLYSTLCQEAGYANTPGLPANQPPQSTPQRAPVDLAAVAHLHFRRRWQEHLMQATPAGARVAVVSKGDDRLLDLPGRTVLHFPSDPAGHYLGYHPAHGDEAVDRFRQLLATGVGYLAFPAPQAWWLEVYPRLHQQLSQRHTRVDLDPEVGVLYRLEPGP